MTRFLEGWKVRRGRGWIKQIERGWKAIAGTAVLQVEKNNRQSETDRERSTGERVEKNTICVSPVTRLIHQTERRVLREICSPNKLLVLFTKARLESSSVFLGLGPGEIFFILLPSEMTDSFIRRLRLHGVELHLRFTTSACAQIHTMFSTSKLVLRH